MAKIILLTFGFNKGKELKALLRKGVSPDDKVVILTHGNLNEEEKKALDALIESIKPLLGEGGLKVLEVPIWDFYEAAIEIVKGIKELLPPGGSIRLVVGGGSRALIAEALFSVVLFKQLDREIDFLTEDEKALVEFPVNVVHPPSIDETDVEIMGMLIGGERNTNEMQVEMSKKRPFPKSTLFKRLVVLREKGLVEIKRRGKPSIWMLTPAGKAYYLAVS